MDFRLVAQQCEDMIRAGQAQNAHRLLAELNVAKVPREWRLTLANLCRRTGLADVGLALLARIVSSENDHESDLATDEERAEYAMLLLRIGATSEATRLLALVDAERVPEVFMYRGIVDLSCWQMSSAILNFNAYLARERQPYGQLLARVNLALAHLENLDLGQAHEVLDACIADAADGKHHRLLCASLSYRAQFNVMAGQFDSARADLARGELLLETAPTADRMNFVKWRLILDGLEQKSIAPFDELRALALKHHNWEVLRQADLYQLKIRFEQERFLHLSFGTPYPGFRDVIFRELKHLPDRSLYRWGPKGAPQLDIRSGQLNGVESLEPGGQNHRFFEIFVRDLYQPLRIAGLFTQLFPDEFYSPTSSPNRTHAAVIRARRWISENQLPLVIQQISGFYSLEVTGPFSLLIPYERLGVDRMEQMFRALEPLLAKAKRLTAREVTDGLNISRRTAQRLLTWALEAKKIERRGNHKNVTYCLPTSAVSKAAS